MFNKYLNTVHFYTVEEQRSNSVAAGICVRRINIADNPAPTDTKAPVLYRDQLQRCIWERFPRNAAQTRAGKWNLCVEWRSAEAWSYVPCLWSLQNCSQWESFGARASFVKVFVVDSQHHLCLERTKSALFICPGWTIPAKRNDEGDSDSSGSVRIQPLGQRWNLLVTWLTWRTVHSNHVTRD